MTAATAVVRSEQRALLDVQIGRHGKQCRGEMTRLLLCLAISAAAGRLSAAQGVPPPHLTTLMAQAHVEGTLIGWCRGQMRSGRPDGYAVAIASAKGGGRYLAVGDDATAVELAAYAGTPELACYTPAEARKLNQSMRRSDTISGGVTPAFATTVVCAFIENTSAACWQYSATARAFVRVGGWQT